MTFLTCFFFTPGIASTMAPSAFPFSTASAAAAIDLHGIGTQSSHANFAAASLYAPATPCKAGASDPLGRSRWRYLKPLQFGGTCRAASHERYWQGHSAAQRNTGSDVIAVSYKPNFGRAWMRDAGAEQYIHGKRGKGPSVIWNI